MDKSDYLEFGIWVLGFVCYLSFEFCDFEFVSDFDIRISNFFGQDLQDFF